MRRVDVDFAETRFGVVIYHRDVPFGALAETFEAYDDALRHAMAEMRKGVWVGDIKTREHLSFSIVKRFVYVPGAGLS